MFKTMTLLIRGLRADAAEAFTDANAPAMLRQQLRDAAAALTEARRAAALAAAHRRREAQALESMTARMAELETRAMAALRQGREDLARDAAGTLAALEAERAEIAAGIERLDAGIARRREQVALCERRLRALERGRRLTEAAGAAQKLRGVAPDAVQADLREAEATLARIEAQQADAEEIDRQMQEMTLEGAADAASRRLAEAGCGPATGPDAAAVLARLRARTAAEPAPADQND